MYFMSTIGTIRMNTDEYNVSYTFSLKKFFGFNLRKKRSSEALHFKVGSSLSFLNLDVSEIVS